MTLQGVGQQRNKPITNVGNYKFTGKRLGKGNFAKVEEALHNNLNVKVAVKIMDVTSIKEDYVIKNLYREAKIMSKLSHPCIATLFQTMQYGNVYYLVGELVGGGDLCTFIKNQRTGKLDERTTRIYARQLVSAISHMHNLGIVHRDLKMENVMLNSFQTHIKIVDFGLSNVFTFENPLRTHCGSPEYAAPELFVEGKHYGPEVDLWSVILYGMVVGQLPFVSNREENVNSQQRRKKLLEQINRGLSMSQKKFLVAFTTEFRNVIAKLLATDSTKRMNVKEMLNHPWLTEKGRKIIHTNPFDKNDENVQQKIYEELAFMLRLDDSDVKNAVKCDPYGNVGGMYNILRYRYTRRLLDGDGITKLAINVVSIGRKSEGRPSTVRTPHSNLSKNRIENACKSAQYRTTRNTADRTVNDDVKTKEVAKITGKLNVKNDEDMTNLRDVLSLKTKQSRPPSRAQPKPQRKLPSATRPLQIIGNATRLTARTPRVIETDSKRSTKVPPPNSAPIFAVKRLTKKIDEEHSECLKLTTTTSPVRKKNISRPETRKEQPIVNETKTKSECKQQPYYPWEKPREAGGDNTTSSTGKKPPKKQLLNDPIARSIAGYVNNVQGNFAALKWTRSGKKHS